LRITNEEHQAISNTIHQSDAEAMIYLFGSRADDSAKGGDIDLLVLSKKINLMDKLNILAQLHQRIGARQIDIAIYPDTTRPFPRMVIQTGVQL
jgi:predicted nucleotidyltransferase